MNTPKRLRAATFYAVQKILIQKNTYQTIKDKRHMPFQTKPLTDLATEFEEGDLLFVVSKSTLARLLEREEQEDDQSDCR